MISPKQLAHAVGVSESSLKRWADDGLLAAVRTAGGHRRIPLAEAVRFIRHMGLTVAHPAELGLVDDHSAITDWADTAQVTDAFYHAIEDGRSADAKALVQSCYLAGWSVAAIADGPCREALNRIGTLWLHAEWGIVVEHRATDITLQVMGMLRTLLPARLNNAPTALGGAGEHDPYMLPSLFAAVSLAECGFNEVNLGPLTPASVLINAMRHYRPALVWLSLSHARSRDNLLANLHHVRDAAHECNAALIVGGRAVKELSPADLQGVHTARTMTELTAFARGRFASTLVDPNTPNG